TLVSSPNSNPTFSSLVDAYDPFDYYRTKGIEAFASTRLFNFTRLRLFYRDLRDRSVPVVTDYRLFQEDRAHRANPIIADGTLRSVGAQFVFDSRKLYLNKGRDVRMDDVQYSRLEAGVEHASPDLIDNDFDFTKYWVSLFRRQRTLGLGVTSLRIFAGGSDRDLPPQRYYTFDHGFGSYVLAGGTAVWNLDQETFVGSRALSISGRHEFRRRLWTQSGIPLIRDIPFWLSVHGTVFWSDFENHAAQVGDEFVRTAGKPYSEIGFGIGNLTPFISPFNLALYFTKQLSDYDNTRDWTIGLGLEL
ncbi:MAG: hypothetical protein KKA42_01605, partial [candidate division Zixibacteria bacterium]|nr:hypothetical protein [candidate division Zixibacteria bacterium]